MANHITNNPVATPSASKAAGFVDGFLSVLENGGRGGNGKSSLFASLLEATAPSTTTTVKLKTDTPPQTSTVGTGSTAAIAADLKQIKSVLNKLQTWVQNHLAKAPGITPPHDGHAAPVPSKPVCYAPQTSVVAKKPSNNDASSTASASSSDAADATSTDDTSTDDATTLADILSALQKLAQLLQQHMRLIPTDTPPVSADETAAGDAATAIGSDGSGTTAADLTSTTTDATVLGAATDDKSILSKLDDIFPDLFRMVRDLEKLTNQTASTTDPSDTSLTDPTATAQSGDADARQYMLAGAGGAPSSELRRLQDYPELKPADLAEMQAVMDRLSRTIHGGNETIAMPIDKPLPAPNDPIQNPVAQSPVAVNDTTVLTAPMPSIPGRGDPGATITIKVPEKTTWRGDDQVKPDPDAVPAFYAQMNNLPSSGNNAASGEDQHQASEGNMAALNGQSSSGGNSATAALAGENVKSANPYTFASQLTATKASTAATSASVVDQVIMRLNKGAKVGQSEMTLQLSPTDLGRIDIKLSFSGDGKVQGTVVASNQGTLDMLVKDVKGLERALQDAGLRADSGSLQFSLGQQQNNGSNTQLAYKSGTNVASNNNGAGETLLPETLTEEAWVVTPGRVNMKV